MDTRAIEMVQKMTVQSDSDVNVKEQKRQI